MPLKIRIHLSGNPSANPYQHSNGLQALFYSWLKRSSSSLASQVHDANQSKPFSISPINYMKTPGSECFFDVSILTDWLASPVLDGLTASADAVRLGNEYYNHLGYEVVQRSEWQEMLECSRIKTDFPFNILTPVAHHAPGQWRKSIVVPSPERYFGSWLNRWNSCSQLAIPDEIVEIFAGPMVVSDFSGCTEVVRLEKGRTFIGYAGNVKFKVLEPDALSADTFKYLQALARFACYCGTGVDTSRGMGQTAYMG